MLKPAECVERLNTREFDGLDPIFKGYTIELWNEGDIEGVLAMMSNERCMNFVVDNLYLLKEVGMYERALLRAYTSIRTNYSGWQMDLLKFLFCRADHQKLREAGDPIPDRATFTLYRGVSGIGRRRRVNSFSWTESPNTAAWFAKRFCHLPEPAVFVVTVPNESIMACSKGRNEAEYLVRLPLPMRPKRLKELPEPILERKNWDP
jgi:hypothetical protein